MSPIAYSLCQKPVLGSVIFFAFLCVFPPLVENEPISLLQPGTKVAKAFKVDVAKRYLLELTFRFASAQDRLADQLVKGMVDDRCADYDPHARELFRVVVTRIPDQSVILRRVVTSLCAGGTTATDQSESIGWLELVEGDYMLEVVNMQAHPGLEHVETQLSLVAGHGK